MAKASSKQKVAVAPAKNTRAKKSTTKKATTNSAKQIVTVPDDVRLQMIAEAAFYNSLNRGTAGDPVQDWLLAEKQIEKQLS